MAQVYTLYTQSSWPRSWDPKRIIPIGGNRTSITLHYNGPRVALADDPHASLEDWIQHWENIARFHLNKNWGTASRPVYGDGCMYHYAFLPDGTRLNLWDEAFTRWHCANAHGNSHSIAIAFAVGGTQDVTDAQWDSAMAFCDEKIKERGMRDRGAVLGHREWAKYDARGQRIPNSPCPGPVLMRRLNLWREGKSKASLLRFEVLPAIGVNVREGPGTSFPIALKGTAKLPQGYRFDADKVIEGEMVAGSKQWAHCATGLGFVSVPLLKQV